MIYGHHQNKSKQSRDGWSWGIDRGGTQKMIKKYSSRPGLLLWLIESLESCLIDWNFFPFPLFLAAVVVLICSRWGEWRPPFTSQDPMKTYNIILKGIDQIEFPRIVSRAAQALIKRLCREVPAERLGYQRGGIDDIKKHRFLAIFFISSSLFLLLIYIISNHLSTYDSSFIHHKWTTVSI